MLLIQLINNSPVYICLFQPARPVVMSERQAPHEVDRSLLDQTLYLASRIYDDPHAQPIPLDLHSACAIGSYQSVKDAIESGVDFNTRNKGVCTFARV